MQMWHNNSTRVYCDHGSGAAIAVLDRAKENTFTAQRQQSAIDNTVFEGKPVKGLPRFMLSRNKVVVGCGALKVGEGLGRYVRREPRPATAKTVSARGEPAAPRKLERTAFLRTGSELAGP